MRRIIQPQLKRVPHEVKLVKDLYTEFIAKYSPDQINANVRLQTLLQYLQRAMSRCNGNYIHVPSQVYMDLIEEFIGYTFPEEDRCYTK